jgi:hypothetical protein
MTDLHRSDSADGRVDLSKIAPLASLLAGVGLLIAIGCMINPATRTLMMGSYIFAFIFWAGFTLGLFALSLLHHSVRGSWGVPILRLMEAGGGYRMLALTGVLFIPIAVDVFSGQSIYEWAVASVVATDEIIQRKTWYLNDVGFVGRTVVGLLLFGALAWGMQKSTRRQEMSGDFREEKRRETYGAVGLVMFFLVITLLMTDWGMSLEPHWFSSIYPLWNVINMGLGGLALVVLIVCLNAKKAPYNEVVSPKLLNDLGNLLFVFTMFWGYISLSQYLIIWNGNIPEFTSYYKYRSNNWWNAVGMALIVGQFLVPWFALLSPRLKKNPERLARISGWILVMHLVDVYWVIIPGIPGRVSPVPAWTDFVALIALGAVWTLFFSRNTKEAALLPAYDNRLQEALHHAH